MTARLPLAGSAKILVVATIIKTPDANGVLGL